ncbi:hypothetical protein KC351_g98 [Hortaea werneckii]|nr:hypothetical protein KC351_g98 [Hortaea werneckii]
MCSGGHVGCRLDVKQLAHGLRLHTFVAAAPGWTRFLARYPLKLMHPRSLTSRGRTGTVLKTGGTSRYRAEYVPCTAGRITEGDHVLVIDYHVPISRHVQPPPLGAPLIQHPQLQAQHYLEICLTKVRYLPIYLVPR